MIDDLTQKLRDFAQERDWEQFHTPKNVAMALVVETSELLEIFQWLTPEQSQSPTDQQRKAIEEEIGDVMNYLIRLSDLLDIDPLACADAKLAINAQKYPASRVKGSAAKYSDYAEDDHAG